jgi:hypothetical protein
MWCGWGLPEERFFEVAHQARTIRRLRDEMAEPWGLVSGRFEFLTLCREQRVLAKTVLLPYGVIEAEPSYPATNLNIDGLHAALSEAAAKWPGLSGVMGNVQTPLLQLPHVYAYTACMWNPHQSKRPPREVLIELAGHLYPEHRELIADGYLALKEPNPAKIGALADRLESLVNQDRLGRLGIFGRKLFPDHRVAATVLLMQLRLRAAQENLMQGMTAATPKPVGQKLLRDYFDAYLAWDTAHGWHKLWGWQRWPLGNLRYDPRFPALCNKLARCFGGGPDMDACLGELARSLSPRFGAETVLQGCIAPLKEAVLAAASTAATTNGRRL